MKYEKEINGKIVTAECDKFTKNIYERLGYELVGKKVKQADKETK